MVSVPCASVVLTWRHRGREQKTHKTNEMTSLIPTHNPGSLITEYIRKGRRDSSTDHFFSIFLILWSHFTHTTLTMGVIVYHHLGQGKPPFSKNSSENSMEDQGLLSQNIRKLRFRNSKLRIKLISFARFWICVSQPRESLQKHGNGEQQTCEKQPFVRSSPEKHTLPSYWRGGTSALRD